MLTWILIWIVVSVVFGTMVGHCIYLMGKNDPSERNIQSGTTFLPPSPQRRHSDLRNLQQQG
jgi:hypothetical protein